jgi:hypothetical protein
VSRACASTSASSAADTAGNERVVRLTIESRATGEKKDNRDNCRQSSLVHTHPLRWAEESGARLPKHVAICQGVKFQKP